MNDSERGQIDPFQAARIDGRFAVACRIVAFAKSIFALAERMNAEAREKMVMS